MVDEYIKACVALITSQLMQIKIIKYNFLPLRFSKIFLILIVLIFMSIKWENILKLIVYKLLCHFRKAI